MGSCDQRELVRPAPMSNTFYEALHIEEAWPLGNANLR